MSYKVNDDFAVGAGVYSAYGFAGEYPKDFVHGDLAGESRIITLSLNPVAAYRVTDQLSLGAGLLVNYGNVKISRTVGAFAQVFDTLKITDLGLIMRTEGFGFGYNLGALFEFNDDNRIGLSYRGASKIRFKNGELTDYTGRYIPPDGGTTDVKMELTLPDIIQFSGYHLFHDDWALHYDVLWAGWEKVKGIVVKDKTGNTCQFNREPDKTGLCVDNELILDNNLRYSAGLTHYFNDNWTFRTGIAFDEQAAETTVALPDMSVLTFAGGTTYQYSPDLSFDAGLSFSKPKTVEFIDRDLTFKQPYLFRVTRSAIFLSLGVNYQF
ncbi:hypothetical protein A8L45_02060 [Veronia pacifica]|uniref:Aromatic hydrocarbon degradation protein n=1 Tax=Veronia pacifica TaxID=1080227 RepID=A0A1C3ERH6_9GAMM|nr:hypothetical protein A8L45_02060 [Veronia pacifica]